MSEFKPDDIDPLRRHRPFPFDPNDWRRGPSPDFIALFQQLLRRVEKLEEDMRVLKKRLKIPEP